MSLVKGMTFKMTKAAKTAEKEHFRHRCRAQGIPLYFSRIDYKWSLMGVTKTQTPKTQTSDPENSDLENSDPENSDPLKFKIFSILITQIHNGATF